MFHCCRNDVVCRNNNAVSVSRINSLFLSPIVGMVIANCGLLWINCKDVSWLCIEREIRKRLWSVIVRKRRISICCITRYRGCV